jgi:threonine dehydratase
MNLNDIYSAWENIHKLIKKTDLQKSLYFSDLTQGDVFLKLENTQITHAFKIRGAINKLNKIKKNQQEIITASSGNHGQAVARASRELGLTAKIIVPEGTPEKKKQLIQKYGAQLIIYGKSVDQSEAYGRMLAEKEGKLYISPYNDPDIIAGQGTIGLELTKQCPDLQYVLVPVGGGGLVSGVGIAIKENFPEIQVIGVQAENDSAIYHSIKAGRILSTEEYPCTSTIAEGLAGGIEQNSITFPLIQKYVDKILLVKEDSIKEAISLLWKKENLVTEGAGAVGVAAVLENPRIFSSKKTAIILSGGNINKDLFNRLIEN